MKASKQMNSRQLTINKFSFFHTFCDVEKDAFLTHDERMKKFKYVENSNKQQVIDLVFSLFRNKRNQYEIALISYDRETIYCLKDAYTSTDITISEFLKVFFEEMQDRVTLQIMFLNHTKRVYKTLTFLNNEILENISDK
jgi:hypothetical protein